MSDQTNWDDRYRNATTTLPWDIGTPATELQDAFTLLNLKGTHILEIGCGSGTNAIWLTQQGCVVTATDISPTAIEMARKKAQDAHTKCTFEVADISVKAPVKAGSADFVFDRGVFHVMPVDQRSTFVERVADALKDGGHWLSITGSKDELRDENVQGPPQLSANEIVAAVEPNFEIHKLERGYFELPSSTKHLSWVIMLKKRAGSSK